MKREHEAKEYAAIVFSRKLYLSLHDWYLTLLSSAPKLIAGTPAW